MLGGRQPVKWLLARTKTEAGELPRLAGMVWVKRLLLRKIASSDLEKTEEGRGPSNSLKRRSRK